MFFDSQGMHGSVVPNEPLDDMFGPETNTGLNLQVGNHVASHIAVDRFLADDQDSSKFLDGDSLTPPARATLGLRVFFEAKTNAPNNPPSVVRPTLLWLEMPWQAN